MPPNLARITSNVTPSINASPKQNPAKKDSVKLVPYPANATTTSLASPKRQTKSATAYPKPTFKTDKLAPKRLFKITVWETSSSNASMA